jgi:CHAD domain-containing protein
MAYRLSLDVPVAESIRGIATEELDRAATMLETPGKFSRSVHNARKSFKRVRAVLHLARPLLKPKHFKRADRAVAGVARNLSGTRDAQVLLDTARALQAHTTDPDPDPDPALFAHLISWLQARRDRAEESFGPAAMQEALDAIRGLRPELEGLPLEDAAFEALLASARQTYAQGRAFMRDVLDSGDDERCHDWRKLVQRHWRHMALFQEAWPAEAKARMRLARDLAGALGAHHDLSILRAAIFENAALFPRRRDVVRLGKLTSARQAHLLSEAAILGERLYAEKPKAFFHRMGVYWETARQSHAVASLTA